MPVHLASETSAWFPSGMGCFTDRIRSLVNNCVDLSLNSYEWHLRTINFTKCRVKHLTGSDLWDRRSVIQ